MKRMATLTLAGALWLSASASHAAPVTQAYLDTACRKTDVKVFGADEPLGSRPARVIIAYTCNTSDHPDQKVEYEALHFACPHRGPRNVAAAVYDVAQQTFLTDREEAGNYRSVIRLDEIALPACDLPL
jgi:hypothetical protein